MTESSSNETGSGRTIKLNSGETGSGRTIKLNSGEAGSGRTIKLKIGETVTDSKLTHNQNAATGSGIKNNEMVANDPNARILINAMQHLGYNNYAALCDLIDNCIDAGATMIKTFVSASKGVFRIVIADNGRGMDMQALDEALKLGSDSRHEDVSDLGKFGMGLSTAGLSLADITTVLTKTADEERILKSTVDVNIIKKENAFVKYLGEADEKEKTFFQSILEEGAGTIVILEECFGIKNKSATQFSNHLKKEIGRIFRKFMGKITFMVNDQIVEMRDPLMLDSRDPAYISEVYSDEDYDISWKEEGTGNERRAVVHVKLVLLPAVSAEMAKNLNININIPNQGLSILRNNREIAFGYLPWIAKHNSYNRVRGELSFDSDMDDAMGVDFTKNGIDMTESVDHALSSLIKPQLVAMKNRAEKDKKASKEEGASHAEAEQIINKKAHLLITPTAPKKEKEEKPKKLFEVKTSEPSRAKNANVRFEMYHCGRNGSIFEAEQEGKTIVIKWNVDHPFYDRFVVENKDNRTLVSSIDFLIYSLAAAQIQAVGEDDDKAVMIDSIISTMSTNMRALLS